MGKRRNKTKFAFITGCKSTKWPPQRTVDRAIRLLAEKGFRDDGFVITGDNRDVEKKIVRACKSYKVRCIKFPANFEMLSGASAEQQRNASALHEFKPEVVIIFSAKPLEHDSVLEHLQKISKKNDRIDLSYVLKTGA